MCEGTFTNLGGSNATPLCSIDTRALEVSGDLITTRGAHKLGYGMNLDREHALENCTNNSAGQLIPQTLRAFYEGGFDPASPKVDFTSLLQGFTAQPEHSAGYGGIQAYVQDEWRARINLALRLVYASNTVRTSGVITTVSHALSLPLKTSATIPTNRTTRFSSQIKDTRCSNLDRIDWSPRLWLCLATIWRVSQRRLARGAGILYDPFQEALSQSFWLNAPKYNSFTTFADNLTPGESPSNLFQDTKDSNTPSYTVMTAGQTLADIRDANRKFELLSAFVDFGGKKHAPPAIPESGVSNGNRG